MDYFNFFAEYQGILSYSKKNEEIIIDLNELLLNYSNNKEILLSNAKRSLSSLLIQLNKPTSSSYSINFPSSIENSVISPLVKIVNTFLTNETNQNKKLSEIFKKISEFIPHISNLNNLILSEFKNLIDDIYEMKKKYEQSKENYITSGKQITSLEELISNNTNNIYKNKAINLDDLNNELTNKKKEYNKHLNEYQNMFDKTNSLFTSSNKKYSLILLKMNESEEKKEVFFTKIFKEYSDYIKKSLDNIADYSSNLLIKIPEIDIEKNKKKFSEILNKFYINENIRIKNEEFIDYDKYKSQLNAVMNKNKMYQKENKRNSKYNITYQDLLFTNSTVNQNDNKNEFIFNENENMIIEQIFLPEDIDDFKFEQLSSKIKNDRYYAKDFIDKILDRYTSSLGVQIFNENNFYKFSKILNNIALNSWIQKYLFEINFALIHISEKTFYQDEKNPFYKIGDKREIIIKKITKGDINFNKEYQISEMGKHLIKKLLNKNQAHRYMARQALKHPWITLNKYDKIPLTVHEKLLVEEYNNKFKYFCLCMLFIMYYKKKYFIKNNNNIKLNKFIDIKNILSKNISSNNSYLPSKRKFIFEIKKDNPEKFPKFLINNIDNENNKNYVLTDNKEEDLINNDNSVNLEEYEQKVIESNIYYENKFIEYRDNTFLPEYSNTNENNNNKLLDIKSKNMNNLIKNINYEAKNDFIFKKSTFTKSSRNIIGDMKNEESKIDSNLNEFTTTLKNYNNDSTPQKLGKNNKNITKPENIFKDLINSKNNNFNIACLSSKKLAKIFKMSNIKLHNSSSKILIKSKEKSKIDSKNNSLVNLDSLKIKNNLIKNFMAVNKSNDDILKKNFTSNKNLHKIGNEKLLPYFEDKKKLSDIKKTNLFKSCIIKNDINNYLKKQKSSVNEEDMDIKRKNANFLSSSKSKPILRNICVNLSKLNRNNNTISNNNIIELLKKLKQTPIKKNNNADIFPKILK